MYVRNVLNASHAYNLIIFGKQNLIITIIKLILINKHVISIYHSSILFDIEGNNIFGKYFVTKGMSVRLTEFF